MTRPTSVPSGGQVMSLNKTPVFSDTHDSTTNKLHSTVVPLLTIPLTFHANNRQITTKALVDCGANFCFINRSFVVQNDLQHTLKQTPTFIRTVDGHAIGNQACTHQVELSLTHNGHTSSVLMDETDTGQFDIILGLNWFQIHNPSINWKERSITYPTEYCRQNCTPSGAIPVQPVVDSPPVIASTPPNKEFDVPTLADNANHLSANPPKNPKRAKRPKDSRKPSQQFQILDGGSFLSCMTAYPEGVGQIYFHPTCTEESRLCSTQVTSVPEKYKDLLSPKESTALPPHRPYDMAINLVPGTTPPFGPIYSLTEPERVALVEYLEENLSKGFIQHSTSSAGAPILFVKKKDGSFRICVDYRGLNKITEKIRYALPLISELLDRMSGAKVFTKIDLKGAFNLLRIKKGDEWKTAFRTRYGLFEYTVMPFGLANAPAAFQHFMNDLFRQYLDTFVVIYLDDLLIFSQNQEEHDRHVRTVLQILQENNLHINLDKCKFDQDHVEFLGLVVTPDGLQMDDSKVTAIREWCTPKSVKDVQTFLGFANYYRRFIKNFSRIATPLRDLLLKNVVFKWSEATNHAFETLKAAFCTAPVLIHPDVTKQFIVEADSSDFCLGAVLSQKGDDGEVHPVAFYSCKLIAAELNYVIHDKELLAIIRALKEWRNYLVGSPHTSRVLTDHQNLMYFTTRKILTARQVRWWQFLTDYDYTLEFIPGLRNGKADALSRRSQDMPALADVQSLRYHALVDPQNTRVLNATLAVDPQQKLFQQICSETATDPFAVSIQKQLLEIPVNDKVKHFSMIDDMLYLNDRIYVPEGKARTEILYQCHDHERAGHWGRKKTTELISRSFWWPKLDYTVRHYIKTCDRCCRSKLPKRKPYGELQPLETPKTPFSHLTADFIVGLPPSNGYDAILVVVDRFSKYAHFIPCDIHVDSATTGKLFEQYVFSMQGLPDSILTDRGPQFSSAEWDQFLKERGIKRHLSTSFHPQTDGQTERVNQILEQYLRCYINHQQDDWTDFLPLAQFCYNNTVHSSTNISPFYAVYGSHPKSSPAIPRIVVDETNAEKAERRLDIQNLMYEEITQAKERYKEYADRGRTKEPEFAIGDKVWLLSRDMKNLGRPSKKLDFRRIGPYPVIEKLSRLAYRLELPQSMKKTYNVFHVSKLEKHEEDNLHGRKHPQPPPDLIADSDDEDVHEEFEVNEILDSRIFRGKLEYYVSWVGYDISYNEWVPAINVQNAAETVAAFHKRYPMKPASQPAPKRKQPAKQQVLPKKKTRSNKQSQPKTPQTVRKRGGTVKG